MQNTEGNSPFGGYESGKQETPGRISGSDFISLGSGNNGNLRGWNRRGHGRGNSQWRGSGTRFSQSPRGYSTDSPQSECGSTPRGSPYCFSPSHSSPLSSYRTDHTRRWNRGQPWNRSNQGGAHSDLIYDISVYYHPSMVENPWKELDYLSRSVEADVDHHTKDKTAFDASLHKPPLNSGGFLQMASDSDSSASS